MIVKSKILKKKSTLIIDQKKLSIGKIYIICSDRHLLFLSSSLEKTQIYARKISGSPGSLTSNKLSRLVFRQLKEYLSKKRKNFKLPIKLLGTEFQLKSWNLLKNISYAQHMSYSQVAKLAGYPKASRAIGNAIGKNPLPLIIPCHRVVAKDGLGGFSLGLALKRKLLRIENLNG